MGDMILAIDGESTEGMTHLEAQNKIKACMEEMVLSIDRWGSTLQRGTSEYIVSYVYVEHQKTWHNKTSSSTNRKVGLN